MASPGAKPPMSRPTVVLIAKRTSWANYVEQAHDPLVLDLLRRNDPTVSRMKAAHEAHEGCLREVERALDNHHVDVRTVDDPNLPFSTDGASLVLSVGGDGTLLSASRQVFGVPILGVNSAPGFSMGFFCGAEGSTIDLLLGHALQGTITGVTLSRMEVLCNGRSISRRVLNEALLCHSCPAATSRYILELDGHTEEQRSSGLYCGPAAGSTAAQRSAGGLVLPLDSDALQLVIREPYMPDARPYGITRRTLSEGQTLRVRSKMYDAFLFIDGPGSCNRVTLGDLLEFRRSDEPLRLLGMTADRHRGMTP